MEAIFRRGKKHSNHGHDVEKMLRGMVMLIRTRYDAAAVIVIRLDAGFFDEKNFKLCDELGVSLIATGKMYEEINKTVAAMEEGKWKVYDNGRQEWSYAEFPDRCQKWERGYRAFYRRPKYDDQQGLLEFARPDNILVTNLDSGEPAFETMPPDLQDYWRDDETVVFHHHQRGADELPHRGRKEFGSEQLPFQRFAPHQAYYYLMLVSFFLFQTFKEDNLGDILPITAYATTIRRKLLDLAAKVVRTGRELILTVPAAAMERLQLPTLWTRCQNAPPIILPS
mgnify:CR=1 FL=1